MIKCRTTIDPTIAMVISERQLRTLNILCLYNEDDILTKISDMTENFQKESFIEGFKEFVVNIRCNSNRIIQNIDNAREELNK